MKMADPSGPAPSGEKAPRGDGVHPLRGADGGTPIQYLDEDRPGKNEEGGTPDGTQLPPENPGREKAAAEDGAPATRVELIGSQVDSLIDALCTLFKATGLVDTHKTRNAYPARSTWLDRHGVDVMYGKGQNTGLIRFKWISPDNLVLDMTFDTKKAGKAYIDNMMTNLLADVDKMRAQREKENKRHLI